MALCLLAGCNSNRSSGIVSGSSITPMPSDKQETSASKEDMDKNKNPEDGINAVLLAVDADNRSISVRRLDEGTEYLLSYTGATDVRNEYDEIVTMPQLALGAIVQVAFDEESLKASSVYISKDAFKSSKITNFHADTTADMITFGSGKYRYDEFLAVLSRGDLIDVSQVIKKDEVTVWGINNKIYSVVVDQGHGYVSFSGYSQFIGGMVQIGRSFLYKVSDNMMITIPEGEYKITMSNGSLTGSKTIQVIRDMQAVVDFSEFKTEVLKTGTISFDITPAGTVLYINGKKTDYTSPVELDYGKYTIRAVCSGYDEYTESITVDTIYTTKTIHLDGETESPSTTQETTAAQKETTAGQTKTTDASNEQETQTEGTGNGNLIIESPEDAEVYIDAVYAGKTPLTIKKDPGEHVITFYKSGYATKSYSIDVSSEDADQKLSFPEMNEE
jgi:hypothetical protein